MGYKFRFCLRRRNNKGRLCVIGGLLLCLVFVYKISRDGIEEKPELLMSIEYYTDVTHTGCIISMVDGLKLSKMWKKIKYPGINDIEPCNLKASLLKRNQTHIWTDVHSGHLKCCYETINKPLHIEEILSEEIDPQGCMNFSTSIEVRKNDEFVRVTCFVEDLQIYQNLFLFTPKKAFTSVRGIPEIWPSVPAYNVLVLGIDSVSRLNFNRTMPKTLSFIRKLGAVEFLGYNNVGDYALSSLSPLLMGLKKSELYRTCEPDNLQSRKCSSISMLFKHAGFYTAIGESSSGKLYDTTKLFLGPPPDYNFHLFLYEDQHVNHKNTSNICLQDKASYEVILDYIKDLTFTLRSTRLFGFFWEATPRTNSLNFPTLMDNTYEQFFKHMFNSKYLNQTIVFLISNHGLKQNDDIMNTKAGRYELGTPLLHVLVPPSFRRSYKKAYRNLKRNAKFLTTPFDVYETLSTLTDLSKLENTHIPPYLKTPLFATKSISLFWPIPKERTCADAWVNAYWCACYNSRVLAKNDTIARGVAVFLIEHVNTLLEKYDQCAVLDVLELLNVIEYTAPFTKHRLRYLVEVRVAPGYGVFKGKLVFVNKDGVPSWIVKSVIRLDPYRRGCLSDVKLETLCVCSEK